ncbi:MAG: hypothetical protein HYS81_04395 [Candidatus Aenigmatarchaeota archaeon]|nr:MAG: hypothetical protein HYS81_04395 [Candidatus Aenigmarchaeota archaeon]
MSSRTDFKKLQTKLGLPKLDELESTFGFVLEEETQTPLQDVKKAIVDTFTAMQEVLEPILFLSEGSSPSHVFEAHALNDKRNAYAELYRKNHELRWRSLEAFFEPTDENVAKFIKECYAAWTKEFKPRMLELTKLMEKNWKEYSEEEEGTQRYLG